MMIAETDNANTIAERAKLWYAKQISGVVEKPENRGKMVAIDVLTGVYEMDSDLIAAVNRLKMRVPNAEMFAMRVGYPTAVRFGAGAFPK
jgi:hypothetical protein